MKQLQLSQLLPALMLLLTACAGSSAPSLPTAPESPADATHSNAPAAASLQRALVLGGGGPTGVAWEIGILKGLLDAGVDLDQADLVVGTSAGAIVGTQIRSGKALDGLYDAQVARGNRSAPPAGADP